MDSKITENAHLTGSINDKVTNKVIGSVNISGKDPSDLARILALSGLDDIVDEVNIAQSSDFDDGSNISVELTGIDTFDFLKTLQPCDRNTLDADYDSFVKGMIVGQLSEGNAVHDYRMKDTSTQPYKGTASAPGTANIAVRNVGKYSDNPMTIPELKKFKDYLKEAEGQDKDQS